jgi:hypothetical protein
MSAPVAIDPVAHVDQLFGYHDLERPRLVQVDPLQIDQHRVFLWEREENVCAANRCRDSPAQPTLELISVCGDPEIID